MPTISAASRLEVRSCVWARGAAVVIGAALAAGCSTNAAAPSGGDATRAADAGAGDTGAGDADATAYPNMPEGKFRALEGDLTATCGGTNGACHVSGALNDAPRWLAPPDAYLSAKGYRGVLPADNDLDHSILLTQIAHTGPALVSSPALDARVRDWIAAELNAAEVPESAPFAISAGSNTVDLSKVLAGLDGAKLVFTASIGTGGLTMAGMRVTGPAAHAVRFESPYFVLVPTQGPVRVDPSNGFTGELYALPSQTIDFYSGLVLLPAWTANDKVAIAFRAIHLENPPDAGVVGSCKSVGTFTSSAVPVFKIDLGGGCDVPGVPRRRRRCCHQCHGPLSGRQRRRARVRASA